MKLRKNKKDWRLREHLLKLKGRKKIEKGSENLKQNWKKRERKQKKQQPSMRKKDLKPKLQKQRGYDWNRKRKRDCAFTKNLLHLKKKINKAISMKRSLKIALIKIL